MYFARVVLFERNPYKNGILPDTSQKHALHMRNPYNVVGVEPMRSNVVFMYLLTSGNHQRARW